MSEYTIKAFPTDYKGRTYRSRLEARWAAFFDLLGWEAEYEPMDLGAWSPDFLIVSPYGGEVLVEVKPVTGFPDAVATKMAAAVHEVKAETSLLIVGVSPVFNARGAQIGWYGSPYDGEPRADWADAFLYWVPAEDRPGMTPDILWEDPIGDQHFHGALTLTYVGIPDDARFYPTYARELWARATSAVQWRPGQ